MRKLWSLCSTVVVGTALVVSACGKKEEAPKEATPATETAAPATETAAPAKPADPLAVAREKAQVFAALPANFDDPANPYSDDKAALGRILYYETRLSQAKAFSCNSCHMLDRFGVDNEPTSPGHNGQRGTRNSPTVFNAAGHLAQFWDGRAANVEEQAKGPVLNPVEMAMADEATVVASLKAIPGYGPLFAKAFPGEADPITYDNMAKAIGAFERRLTTPSRWDAFLKGDDKALTDAELQGFITFNEVGCMACHNGALVGGSSYQKLGAVKAWPTDKDKGRFDATKKEEDLFFFKVPSLRNIAKTGPYFHDGSVADLAEAVKMMAVHQLGKELDAKQVESILAWFGALTGEVDATYTAKPELPADAPPADAPPADAPVAPADAPAPAPTDAPPAATP